MDTAQGGKQSSDAILKLLEDNCTRLANIASTATALEARLIGASEQPTAEGTTTKDVKEPASFTEKVDILLSASRGWLDSIETSLDNISNQF